MSWQGLRNVWKRVRTAIDSSNAEHIRINGFLPGEWKLETSVTDSIGTISVRDAVNIGELLTGPATTVTAFFVGMGSHLGFVADRSEDNAYQYLPSDWWHAKDRNLYLYAFACHSAEYLRDATTTQLLNGALGYEGKLWLNLDGRDPASITMWKEIIEELNTLLQRRGHINHEVQAEAMEVYLNRVRRRSGAMLPTWISSICLMKHVEALTFIQGDRL